MTQTTRPDGALVHTDAAAPYVDPATLPVAQERAYVVETYDSLAKEYDARYDSPAAHIEDEQVARWLDTPHLPDLNILDIGCGTGLLHDLLGERITQNRYVGIDPSEGMLREFLRKHRNVVLFQMGLEEMVEGHRKPLFDLIVGMFGSPSYCSPESIAALPRLLNPGGSGFLMLLEPGYLPDFHDHAPPHLDTSREAALSLPSARMTRWSHYWVVTFRDA